MMKKNDIIICINDYLTYSFPERKYVIMFFKYEKYKINDYFETFINESDDSGFIEKNFQIKNDNNTSFYFSEDRISQYFILLKEYRKNKLKKINESR